MVSNKQKAQQMLRERDMRAVAAEVQNSTFFHTPLVFLGRIQDHRILRFGSASPCW